MLNKKIKEVIFDTSIFKKILGLLVGILIMIFVSLISYIIPYPILFIDATLLVLWISGLAIFSISLYLLIGELIC